MSTKIYFAWRVPISKLNETFDFVKPQIYKNGEEILKRLMANVLEKVIKPLVGDNGKNEMANTIIKGVNYGG